MTFVRNYTSIHEAEDITIGDFVPGDALVFNATMDGLVPLRAPASLEGLTTGQVPYFDGAGLADAKIQYSADGRIIIGPSANGREMIIGAGGGEITLPTAPLYFQKNSAFGVLINNHLTVYGGTVVGIDDWAATSDHLMIGTEVGGNKISMWDRVSSGTLRQAGFVSTEFQVGADGDLDYLSQIDELAASYAAPFGRIFRRAYATPTGTTQKLGDVVGGNVAEIEETGFLKFAGAARPTDDLLPLAVSLGFGSAQPDFSIYYGNMRGWEFVGTGVIKEIQVSFQTRHGREDGSDVGPHLHIYIPDDASGGDIKFFIEWHWDNVGDTGAPAISTFSHAITRTPSEGISRNHIVSFGDLSGTGMGISSILTCRIYRDPADVGDTFGSSVWLRSIDAHAIDDTIGSRGTFTK